MFRAKAGLGLSLLAGGWVGIVLARVFKRLAIGAAD